jgi:hypothetical protein
LGVLILPLGVLNLQAVSAAKSSISDFPDLVHSMLICARFTTLIHEYYRGRIKLSGGPMPNLWGPPKHQFFNPLKLFPIPFQGRMDLAAQFMASAKRDVPYTAGVSMPEDDNVGDFFYTF